MEEQVSVVCITYNHEKYIRKALEGFVRQRTNFLFKVYVHDDASTDQTRKIICEYVEKYPNIFFPILQKENQYSKKISITQTYILPHINGKYVAWCEGDDYWCDENKLQKQFDMLEAHPECIACVHNTENIYEDGTSKNTFIPKAAFDTEIIEAVDIMDRMASEFPFHITSYFIRSSAYKQYIIENPLYKRLSDVGDEPLLLMCCSGGKIAYINETMSCYRNNVPGGWQSRITKEKLIAHYEKMIDMMWQYNLYTHNRYDTQCENYIKKMRFLIASLNLDFKTMVRKDNRRFLSEYGWKYRTLITVSSIAPFLYSPISRLYSKLSVPKN